jgi:hypothetical protein
MQMKRFINSIKIKTIIISNYLFSSKDYCQMPIIKSASSAERKDERMLKIYDEKMGRMVSCLSSPPSFKSREFVFFCVIHFGSRPFRGESIFGHFSFRRKRWVSRKILILKLMTISKWKSWCKRTKDAATYVKSPSIFAFRNC